MSFIRSWSEIADTVVSTTNDIRDDIAEGIKNYICDNWNKYPDKMVGTEFGISKLEAGLLNKACAPQAPITPPIPPFTGGQCCDKTYTVRVGYTITRCFNNDVIANGINDRTLSGKINGVFVRACTNSPSLTCVESEAADCQGNINVAIHFSTTADLNSVACFVTNPLSSIADNIDPGTSQAGIIQVVTNDGSPDDCGDPPAPWPNPVPLDPADWFTTITINDYSGNTFDIDINLVLEDNDLEKSVRFPFAVNVGGVIVNADLSGLTFNNNSGNISFNPSVNILPSGEKHPYPAPFVPPIPPVTEPPPTADNFEETVKDETDPKEEDEIEGLKYVKVKLTTLPVKGQQQSGNDAPDIYFAGWFEFRSAEGNFNRKPIHFIDNVFKAPEGATGYAYTLTNGAKGFATTYQQLT